MAIEIERKFLLDLSLWKPIDKGLSIRQGYICTEQNKTVRVRTKGDKGYLTVKGKNNGISRLEYEYEIPVEDANSMLDNLCQKPLIEKTRHVEEHFGHIWEIDVFFGDNEGLVVAEVELQAENEEVIIPAWIVKEVSGDPRYYNSSLQKLPFKAWLKD